MFSNKSTILYIKEFGLRVRIRRRVRGAYKKICSEIDTSRIRMALNINGFTLIEALVALMITALALGAGLRAIGSITSSSENLKKSIFAEWSANNQLADIRLTKKWPVVGRSTFNCPQGDFNFICEQITTATANPLFLRLQIMVYDNDKKQYELAQLSAVISNE